VCTDCGAGKYSAASGATAESTCSVCPSNSDAPAGSDAASDCICNAGFTSDGAGGCEACAAGTYKAGSGNEVCTDCGAGKYSAASGATAQSTCSACTSNSNAPAGSDAASDCMCNTGFTSDGAGGCVQFIRCYDSAGDATQCQISAHSCVTFVELTQSVSSNVSVGPFLNENTRKCGTSLVFPFSMDTGAAQEWTSSDSPMCDPDICEVVVEVERWDDDAQTFLWDIHVIPFGPHPTQETEHTDSRTVDFLWQYGLDGFYAGMVHFVPEAAGIIPKCVPKNTAVCHNNFRDAIPEAISGYEGAYYRPAPTCEATTGCIWDAISLRTTSSRYWHAPRDYQYLGDNTLSLPLESYSDQFGSCQASNPREYGTDKIKLVNATSMCADKTLAEDTGIVCDGPGVKVTSTGSMVYECCRGDLCNKDFMEALVNLQVPWDLCVNTCARLCIKMYACKYVCTCIISLCVYA